jgi:hypothetical protein
VGLSEQPKQLGQASQSNFESRSEQLEKGAAEAAARGHARRWLRRRVLLLLLLLGKAGTSSLQAAPNLD